MSGYIGGTASSDIARLRRMIGEPGTTTYSDSHLGSVISGYPLPDNTGEWPYLASGSVNTDWVATYDLAASAAEIWEEKGVTLVDNFDFTADGATFHKLQVTETYERQARKWRSRRTVGGHTAIIAPATPLETIFNINDPYE